MGARSKMLSVVIPAYNEEARISLTLIRTLDYLEAAYPRAEVIVVDDGSTDETARIVDELIEERREPNPSLRLIRLGVNRGKGAAVRAGMLAARGDWKLFMDADLSTPIEEVRKLLRFGRQGYDVVIGSRGMRDSDVRLRQSLPREYMGRTFNLIVRALVMGGIKDTQCGFKLFTSEAAQALFENLEIEGFAFDVEVLDRARRLGMRIREVPVVWYHAPNSKVSPLTDASRMFVDLVKLRFRRGREH